MQSVSDFPWEYKHVAADAAIRTGRGVLHTIVLNGFTTTGDITVYDSATETGTVIAILHLNITASISVQPITLLYDIEFKTGLYIGFDGAVAADLTVSYK